MRNKKLAEENKRLSRLVEKYKKRVQRSTNNSSKDKVKTPRSEARKIMKSKDKKLIGRRLIFGEALCSQIKTNLKLMNNPKEKHKFISNIFGKKEIFKKYRTTVDLSKRLMSGTNHSGRYSLHTNNGLNKWKENRKIQELKIKVRKFLEQDDHSCLAPGKRDTITLKKEKLQKRYLNDTLKNLHVEFCKTFKMSYALFCRLRPFNIIHQKFDSRDTCLCKQHANISYLISSLQRYKIIDERNWQELLDTQYCERFSVNCLLRNCSNCSGMQIKFKEFNGESDVFYDFWGIQTETYKDRSGKTRNVKLTAKLKLKEKAYVLVQRLQELREVV